MTGVAVVRHYYLRVPGVEECQVSEDEWRKAERRFVGERTSGFRLIGHPTHGTVKGRVVDVPVTSS